MKRKNILWIILAVIGVVAILLLPRLMFFGRSFGMHTNYGMRSGWMFLGLLIPAGIIVLLIAGGVWLGNVFSGRTNKTQENQVLPAAVQTVCPNCSRKTETDWNTCPYCGTDLTKSD